MKKGSILPIALMAFALVAFLALVYFAVTMNKNTSTQNANVAAANENQNVNATNKTNESTNTNAAVNVNTAVNTNTTVDATKDWKTYANSEHEFSIRYPKEWLVKELNNQTLSGHSETYDFIQFYVNNTPTNPSDSNISEKINFSIFPRQGSETAEETYQRLVPTDLSGLPKQQLVVGGEAAIMYSGFPGFTSSDGVFFAHGTDSFLFKSYIELDQAKQILGTLAFTDATAGLPAGQAGWKAYTNTALQYSLKYPPSWKVSTCGYGPVWFGTAGVLCATDAPTTDIIVSRYDAGMTIEQAMTYDGKKDMIEPKQTTITVSGIQATRLTGTTKKDGDAFYGGGLFKDFVYVFYNDRLYRIGYFSTTGQPVHDDFFVDFLSTFTFTS